MLILILTSQQRNKLILETKTNKGYKDKRKNINYC